MKHAAEEPSTLGQPAGVRLDPAVTRPRARAMTVLAAHRDAVALLLVLGVSLAYVSVFFGKIHQVDIDVGMDFEAPDMLLHGKTLYNDIAYRYGPLAPWFHYCLFRLFGVSAAVILGASSAAALAIVLLAFLIARQILPPAPAVTASLIVLVDATYGPHLMNYAAPYTFSATYGLLFSLLTLYSASQGLDERYSPWDTATGAAAGLAVVCKHDFAIIALLLLTLQMAFRWQRHRRAAVPGLLAGAGSCVVTVAAFALPLLRRMTPARLLDVVYPKQYLHAVRYFDDVTHYWGSRAWLGVRWSLGDFLLNLGFVLAASILVVLLLGLVRGERPKKVSLILAATGLPFLWRHEYLGSYPILLHATVVGFSLADRHLHVRRKVIFLTIAAAAFLFRVLPSPDVLRNLFALHYFVPSLIVYLYFCHNIVAPRLHRFFSERRLQAAVTAVFFLSFAVYPFARTYYPWAHRTIPIVTERGVIRVEAREAPKVQLVLDQIRRFTSPRDAILMIPHGALYYFLSDRRPALKYLYFTPGELIDGPAEIEAIRQLNRAPPKLVILDDIALFMFFPGPRNHFGEAYNVLLGRWIWQNYREVRTIEYYNRPVRFLIPRAGAGGFS